MATLLVLFNTHPSLRSTLSTCLHKFRVTTIQAIPFETKHSVERVCANRLLTRAAQHVHRATELRPSRADSQLLMTPCFSLRTFAQLTLQRTGRRRDNDDSGGGNRVSACTIL